MDNYQNHRKQNAKNFMAVLKKFIRDSRIFADAFSLMHFHGAIRHMPGCAIFVVSEGTEEKNESSAAEIK
jgi:hypothetical protein